MDVTEVYPVFREALLEWWLSCWSAWFAAGSGSNRIGAVAISSCFLPDSESSEWRAVSQEIKRSVELSRQLGHRLGSILWLTNLSAEDIAVEFAKTASRAASNVSGPSDEALMDEFEQQYQLLESFLSSEFIEYEAVAPVLGLQCEYPPILLSQGVSICELDPFDDALAGITAGDATFVEATQRSREGAPSQFRHAFCYRFRLQKLIDADASPDEARRIYEGIEDLRRSCVRAIAVTTFSLLVPLPARIREVGWRRGKGSISLSTRQFVVRVNGLKAMITAQAEIDLRMAWNHLECDGFERDNAAMRVVLDRLVGLGSRADESDKLVDALIACESLFTLGSSSRAELSFRAALNAAVTSPRFGFQMKPGHVLTFMQRAYDLRSKIVHGDHLRDKDLRHNGQVLQLEEWTYFAAELARRGAIWAFSLQSPGSVISVDWAEHYFPSSEV